MKKNRWKKQIITEMKEIGTYKDAYLSVIETLSDILERRDQALKEWKDDGCKLTMIKTSDRGAKNTSKNPLLAILQECERDALSYWSQLGLTPKGLQKSFAEDKEKARGSLLVEALKEYVA